MQRINSDNFLVRFLRKDDNAEIKLIIQSILRDFGANKIGFAYVDQELDDMYHAYSQNKSCYFVVEKKKDNKILGGVGIGPLLGGSEFICELKKMYLLPEGRGKGLGQILLGRALLFAKKTGYSHCYLETLNRMDKANMLYQRFGFTKMLKPIGNTGHFGCDSWYLKEL